MELERRLTDDGNAVAEVLNVFPRRVESVEVVEIRESAEEVVGAAHLSRGYQHRDV